jgi:uncharacterized protein
MRFACGALFAATIALLALPAGAQQTITQWNFNSTTPDNNTATGVTTPSIGTGTALLVGTTATFASGASDGGSSDPAVSDDSAWNTTGFPNQSVGSLTEGVQFNVSTVGFTNIVLTFDVRLSNTASRFWGLQVSTDGANFSNVAVSDARSTSGLWRTDDGEIWFNTLTANLAGVTGVNDNPNFAVRILAAFDPANNTAYTAANNGSTYAPTGTARFDMVTIAGLTRGAGAVAPEPGTVALLTTGLLSMTGIARRRIR